MKNLSADNNSGHKTLSESAKFTCCAHGVAYILHSEFKSYAKSKSMHDYMNRKENNSGQVKEEDCNHTYWVME